jgi:hypothetical protein
MIKGWFTYAGDRDWYTCVAVLENGHAFATHVCSHPHFAPGDLYYGRPERMAILKVMYPEGIDWQGVVKDTDVPAEVFERNKDEAARETRSAEYLRIKAELGYEEKTA